MNLFWSNNPAVPNFGDDINKFIFSKAFNETVDYVPSNHKEYHFTGIGSILHHANKYSVPVGSGFINSTDTCIEAPQHIIAVRGKLTRDRLLKMGIKCPESYIDLAVLFPNFFNPHIPKKFKLGIIPHYIDKNIGFIKNLIEGRNDVLLIDIQNLDHFDFVTQVLSCDLIASSTLHGIIIADAYGIPSSWLEFSNNVIGDGFKFYDYFSSTNINKHKLQVNAHTTVQQIFDSFIPDRVEINIPHITLRNCE